MPLNPASITTPKASASPGMKVLAWNRSPKTFPDVQFVGLDRLLAESNVLSLHLC